MPTVISFMTLRGGCSKTTSALNISYNLAQAGLKVLAIDLDPQGHLAKGFGIILDDHSPNLFQALTGKMSLDEIKVSAFGVDILPSTRQMYHFEAEFVAHMRRDFLLIDLIEDYIAPYDYVIIDNHPSLSLGTVNAIAASDYYLVPVFPETWALDALHEVNRTVAEAKRFINPDISLLGILAANVEERTSVAQTILAELAEIYPNDLFDVFIPKSIAVSEAIVIGEPLCHCRPTSKPAQAYQKLTTKIHEICMRRATDGTQQKGAI